MRFLPNPFFEWSFTTVAVPWWAWPLALLVTGAIVAFSIWLGRRAQSPPLRRVAAPFPPSRGAGEKTA